MVRGEGAPFDKRASKALILAPFGAIQLDRLRLTIEVRYESWLTTRLLHDPDQLGSRLNDEDIDILVVESDFVFEEVFERAEALRFVGICRNATNQVEIAAATRHGVMVVNTPGRNAQAVAEHVLGLMLSVARQIPKAHTYVTGGSWCNPAEPYIAMRGIELCGRTLGIIGYGAIGRRLASMAAAVGMNTLAYDPYVASPPPGVSLVGLEPLVSDSDFVALLAPVTEETQGLLDERRIGLMKPEAYLINAGGAALVDQEALVHALAAGGIAGAAMDVFESHPVSPTNPLLALDNVVLTPHLGGATQETVERHSEMMAGDIERYLSGERPLHLVNPEVWELLG